MQRAKGGGLALHRPPSGSLPPLSSSPWSLIPATRYQPDRLPHLFGQQLAYNQSLTPPTAGVFEVGLDWHHVLDTMLSPVRTPTTALKTGSNKWRQSLPIRLSPR